MADERTPLPRWGSFARGACWPLFGMSPLLKLVDELLHDDHAHSLIYVLRIGFGVAWLLALATWAVAYFVQRDGASENA